MIRHVVMNTPELICTYFTLAGDIGPFDADNASPVSLEHRARAAAEAGYRGLGFGVQDIARLMERLGEQRINAILNQHNLVHRELEVLLDWFVDGERRKASDIHRRLLLEAAGAIGARHIKVGGDLAGHTWPLTQLIDEFGLLCDQAARQGCAITIELFPTSNLADLQTGRVVVEGAARSNGGLLLDIWHMQRGNIPLEAIAALPGQLINHIELNDGTLLPVADYITDTIANRRLPGEGAFPCRAFLDAVHSTGYQGLYGVEILSTEWRKLSPETAANRSWQATAGLFN